MKRPGAKPATRRKEKPEKTSPKWRESKIVEINGIFLGAAVALRDRAGWRFIATHARAEPADGRIGATFQEAATLAKNAFWAGRTASV